MRKDFLLVKAGPSMNKIIFSNGADPKRKKRKLLIRRGQSLKERPINKKHRHLIMKIGINVGFLLFKWGYLLVE